MKLASIVLALILSSMLLASHRLNSRSEEMTARMIMALPEERKTMIEWWHDPDKTEGGENGPLEPIHFVLNRSHYATLSEMLEDYEVLSARFPSNHNPSESGSR